MSKGILTAIAILAAAGSAAAQSSNLPGKEPGKAPVAQSSPKTTTDKTETPARYANMPEAAVPFGKFTKSYKEWFVDPDTLDYFGAARDETPPEMLRSKTVNIGFLGPLDDSNPEGPYGKAMLNGATMAVDEANAAGGWRAKGAPVGRPFLLKVHNDLPLWGASSTEIVKMDFDEHVVGILGSIDGASTHIMLRTTLKLEIPIMDTATTDPTVTQTRIQWLMHNFPDDRQQGYALADYVFNRLKLQRIGILRTQSRYARIGVEIFAEEARRLRHTPVLEMKFERGDTDFSAQLKALKDAKIQGLVIWGEPPEAGLILKQMRAAEMSQPAFGSSRLAYPDLLNVAGPAAEGLVTTSVIDPASTDPMWIAFRDDYRKRFQAEPDGYAAYGYDGMRILIKAIGEAGLNRGLIMDALRRYGMKEYGGVSGRALFDYTLNNIGPIWMARVEEGKFVYFPAHQETATTEVGAKD
ncbi:MAG TPA: ABC transporter substrate-binding protein [Candidatus Acidoferrum sp.]|nr:ABC transporter substrate-binding protein [Candidatus Acidoferrum sp.]